jgi:hypothetical protein
VVKPQMIHNETLEMDENNPLFAICPFFWNGTSFNVYSFVRK